MKKKHKYPLERIQVIPHDGNDTATIVITQRQARDISRALESGALFIDKYYPPTSNIHKRVHRTAVAVSELIDATLGLRKERKKEPKDIQPKTKRIEPLKLDRANSPLKLKYL